MNRFFYRVGTRQRLAESLVMLVMLGTGAVADDPFAARFADPPPGGRIIKIIHGWPDQPEAQDRLIERVKGQGFGGVVCNVAFEQYLESEPKWQAFVRAVSAAKQAGLVLWLYDERGYPSGNAGGLVLRDHPEWEARGLLVTDLECGGGPARLELPPGEPVLVGAFPVVDGHLDASGQVDLNSRIRDGAVDWSAPSGRWRLVGITRSRLYEGTHADGNLWEKLPYINLLEREPTARFLEITHERYAKYLGADLGRHFVATFTDEPSLMSCFLKPMPYRPLPWSAGLPGEFERRRGYPLDDAVVLSLVADTGLANSKHRHDFCLTIGELVSENFFGQIQETCRRLGLPSGGHLLMEEGFVSHVPLYGDFLRCARRLDAPSMDCLTSVPSEVPWYVARLLASAGELERRTLVMSETSDHGQVWRSAGDSRPKRLVTEGEIRGTCNRLFVGGVNTITSYYSFTDLTDEALRRLNEWVGRCAYLLTGGHQVADVALVYPVESMWVRFTPSRVWANDATAATQVEHLCKSAAESLFAARRDFTFVDSRGLADAAVEPGALVHGPLRWRVVVLPGVDTLPMAAWENLERFVRDGGAVIALGQLPANSEREFPAPGVARLAREIFGPVSTAPRVHTHARGGAGIYLPPGTEAMLPLVLDGLLEPDVKVDDPRAPLRVTHRRVAGREVYLVINDSPEPWTGAVKFAAARGEHWDPGTGRRHELAVTLAQRGAEAAGDEVALALEPFGAALFRFAEAHLPRRHLIAAGALPNLTFQRVKAVEPTMAHGEFVGGDLTSAEARLDSGSPAWRAVGTLTRSQVDTFLFLQFRYEPPLDLSAADCLEVETAVPTGQSTASRILVILSEEGGGDFIADTGRSLSQPERQQALIPLNRFQHAGWSQDADGRLDLSRVRDIRVGWGGYLGREGEEVEFSVTLPQVGVLRRPGVRE